MASERPNPPRRNSIPDSEVYGSFFVARLERLQVLYKERDYWCKEDGQLIAFARASTYQQLVRLGMRSAARKVLGL